MSAISFDPRQNLHTNKINKHGHVEEIPGLIKVYKGGQVERPSIIPDVPCMVSSELKVTAKDIILEKSTNLWARIYVPNSQGKLPMVIYFHGGGFCVGSPAWSCYHDFLATLASKANCVILSINYRLAPENRLPAAYEDGFKTIMWLKQKALEGSNDNKWWLNRCQISSMFLAGDSAGANIAYNVVTQLPSIKPLSLKAVILIQPFFGGEARKMSEKHATQPVNSALTLTASDTYWRLSLPNGANRDHPWCNPLVNGITKLRDIKIPTVMVCISEMDILKDRTLEFCATLATAGKRVETCLYKGVGHAFQILHNSSFSQQRTQEMISHLKAFLNQ